MTQMILMALLACTPQQQIDWKAFERDVDIAIERAAQRTDAKLGTATSPASGARKRARFRNARSVARQVRVHTKAISEPQPFRGTSPHNHGTTP